VRAKSKAYAENALPSPVKPNFQMSSFPTREVPPTFSRYLIFICGSVTLRRQPSAHHRKRAINAYLFFRPA
jgi:hypothetical protein